MICPNCQSDRHKECCARCGALVRGRRCGSGFCSRNCVESQAWDDRESNRIEREIEREAASIADVVSIPGTAPAVATSAVVAALLRWEQGLRPSGACGDIVGEAAVRCAGCIRHHRYQLARRCGVPGCECYCQRGGTVHP